MSRAAITALYELQQLDLEMERVATDLDALRRSLAEDATKPTRDAAARARTVAERAQREAREAEAVVHEGEARIQRHEARLYGGGTAMRDLSALEIELTHMRSAHAQQEEHALKLMLAAEDAQAAAQRAVQAHTAAERAWSERRNELRSRVTERESALGQLQQRRVEHTASIDAESLRRYEAVRRAHGGRGVALVQNGTCQACRVAITSGALQRVRASVELVACQNCGRLLYMP
ncbi:MAG TPA: C4-type zinc ribbon domain-containing protein [Ktedonobacterales bacterium]